MVSVTSSRDLAPGATSDTGAASRAPFVGPVVGVGVGVVAPYDFALDRELWRWVPGEATLHLIRTVYSPLPVTVEQAELVGDRDEVAQCTRGLIAHRARGHGLRLHVGQLRGRARRRARSGVVHARRGRFGGRHDQRRAGRGVVPPRHHPAGRGHPVRRRRDGAAARLPRGVGRDASPGLRTSGWPGGSGRCPTPSPPRSSATWPPRAAKPSSSPARTCRPTTSSRPLEAELGIPVLTANQVTMWAALRRVDLAAVGPGQSLLREPA